MVGLVGDKMICCHVFRTRSDRLSLLQRSGLYISQLSNQINETMKFDGFGLSLLYFGIVARFT